VLAVGSCGKFEGLYLWGPSIFLVGAGSCAEAEARGFDDVELVFAELECILLVVLGFDDPDCIIVELAFILLVALLELRSDEADARLDLFADDGSTEENEVSESDVEAKLKE
jgi:hypothetical protein